jgi:diguanylate cyclase (GGDEF)-like protein
VVKESHLFPNHRRNILFYNPQKAILFPRRRDQRNHTSVHLSASSYMRPKVVTQSEQGCKSLSAPYTLCENAPKEMPRNHEQTELEPEDRVQLLQQELNGLEGRDLELWAIGALISVTVTGALLVIVSPKLVWDFRSFVQNSNSAPELVLGLFMLILILNAYLFCERRQILSGRRELLRQLIIVERTAQLDPLTGAFSRRCLDRLLEREISRARRKRYSLSMLLIDVDDFKNFNSNHGHLVGDQVLTQVSSVITSALRASDIVIRYGGDEFVALLADTDQQQAEVAVGRIHDYLLAWNAMHQDSPSISVTCGIAGFAEGMSQQQLIKAADEDMFSKKRVAPSQPMA